MQAIRFLHSALTQVLPSVDSRRLKTLICGVSALLRGRRLILTGLGQFMPSNAYPRKKQEKQKKEIDLFPDLLPENKSENHLAGLPTSWRCRCKVSINAGV
ncbi:hypothetical protein [Pseudomonas sp. GM25]|uniref:hypothetical protein n=1 Tax=Pseudomonas sp. GM25 TaxID=1144327 RepID=UPI0012F92F42|nr:hypothetical protein [Pseudomonas sp. GM25]